MGPSSTSHLLMALSLGVFVSGCSKGNGIPDANKNPPLEQAAAPVSRPVADDRQLVEVSIQVDKRGNPVKIQATSGNSALYGPAIEAARQWKHFRRCDCDVNPIPYETRLSLSFDRSGHLVEIRPPIFVGNCLGSPKLLRRVEPEYPKELMKKGIGGTVVLQIRTDEKGNVVEAKALRGPSGLYQSAINAVLKWKYKPRYSPDCSPIPSIATATMIFNAARTQGHNSGSRK